MERKRPVTPEVACKEEDVNLSAGQENGGTILPHFGKQNKIYMRIRSIE